MSSSNLAELFKIVILYIPRNKLNSTFFFVVGIFKIDVLFYHVWHVDVFYGISKMHNSHCRRFILVVSDISK